MGAAVVQFLSLFLMLCTFSLGGKSGLQDSYSDTMLLEVWHWPGETGLQGKNVALIEAQVFWKYLYIYILASASVVTSHINK